MANNKRLNEVSKGTQFTKTRRPKNAGRRKSQLKDFMSAEKVSLDDFKRMVNEIAMCKSAEELRSIKNDKSNPAIVCLFASVLEQAIKKGRMYDANMIIDRLFGKATEKIKSKVTADVMSIDVALTPDEQKQYAERIKAFMNSGITIADLDKENGDDKQLS